MSSLHAMDGMWVERAAYMGHMSHAKERARVGRRLAWATLLLEAGCASDTRPAGFG